MCNDKYQTHYIYRIEHQYKKFKVPTSTTLISKSLLEQHLPTWKQLLLSHDHFKYFTNQTVKNFNQLGKNFTQASQKKSETRFDFVLSIGL